MEHELTRLNNVLKAAGRVESCCKEYQALKSDEERFEYTLRLLQELKFEPKIEVERKSSEKSLSYRKQGNDLFTSKKSGAQRDATLELYTKSIAFAEPNSIELAYAYSNRSALLFSARLYDHCLRDIERALRINHLPENLVVKLLSRRIRCLEATGKSPSIGKTKQEAVEELRRCIEDMSVDESLKEKYRGSLLNTKEAGVDRSQREMIDEAEHKPPTPTDNPELPGVSAALKVSYDEMFGRHVTATRRIYPGEVLAVQKGYATILAPEHFHTHCSNCLRQAWSGVACDRCPLAVYCDEKCRDEAWRDHHDVECGVVSAMVNMEFNLLGLMSLRLAIRAVRDAGGFENLRAKLALVDAWPDLRTKGFTGSPKILDESDYSSVYTLAKNTEKRSGPDLFGRSFNSVYIVYYVATMTEFLGETFARGLGAISSNSWSIFVGGLLTTHQQIIPSNVHAVMESKGLFDRERGASLIPFLSLFNHSCDFMVTRVHYGSHVVLYALQNIDAGEQVYDNYGMHYAIDPRFDRQLRLQRQFFFTCCCLPCQDYWPLFDEVPSLARGDCGHDGSLNVHKMLGRLHKYVEMARDNPFKVKPCIVKDVVELLQELYRDVELPCREVDETVETLKKMYGLLSTRYQSLCDTT